MPGEPPSPPARHNPPADPSRPGQPHPLGEPERSGRPDPAHMARQRRRLAEVFGDVLPETTGDDRPDDGAPGSADERWYTENRPPHHLTEGSP
jgi:hypothetical protein